MNQRSVTELFNEGRFLYNQKTKAGKVRFGDQIDLCLNKDGWILINSVCEFFNIESQMITKWKNTHKKSIENQLGHSIEIMSKDRKYINPEFLHQCLIDVSPNYCNFSSFVTLIPFLIKGEFSNDNIINKLFMMYEENLKTLTRKEINEKEIESVKSNSQNNQVNTEKYMIIEFPKKDVDTPNIKFIDSIKHDKMKQDRLNKLVEKNKNDENKIEIEKMKKYIETGIYETEDHKIKEIKFNNTFKNIDVAEMVFKNSFESIEDEETKEKVKLIVTLRRGNSLRFNHHFTEEIWNTIEELFIEMFPVITEEYKKSCEANKERKRKENKQNLTLLEEMKKDGYVKNDDSILKSITMDLDN